ncbi:AraC-type DNA-binding protein [Alteromonadaceae bacterium Bs31]|nr:AraC-type DNA-binding protein [Alteromonadaceae bacterium Bs31]
MEYAHSLTTFTLLVATLGVLSLSVPLLLLSSNSSPAQLPLLAFLISSGIANGLPAFIELYPPLELYGLAIWLPCYLIMPPSLWLYTKAITSPTPWHLRQQACWHLVPAGLALVVSVLLATLPKESLEQIFDSAAASPTGWPQLVVIAAFALMVLWFFLSGVYVVRILITLIRYRAKLKNLFANNEKRELHWLSWAVVVLAGTWVLSLFFSIPLLSNQSLPLPINLMALMHFVLLWSLSLFGLHQKPGFEGRYLAATENPPESSGSNNEKYQKSGLQEQQLERIAEKVEHAMGDQKLYLDATLSLQKLAVEIQVSPNYLSQTLNETLDKCFYDYVNGWRIQHAIPEVLQARKTVLDIAMDAGFNARSSFYKAFKNETGHSPSEYRKRNTTHPH